MTPPGLSFASVSERAWEKAGTATLPRFYWDWSKLRKAQAKGSTPFTPATSTVVALAEALRLLLEDGLEAAFARHVAIGRACRAGVKALGLELYSPDEDRSAVLTAALDTGGRRRRRACGSRSATGTGSRSPAGTATSCRGSSASATSATSGSTTSPTALDAIEQELAAAGVDVEPGVAVAGRARRLRAASGRLTTMRVLVREPIAEPGLELLRSHFDVDVDDGVAARGDHRPVRRDRDPVGDAADRRPDRARRRGSR